MAIGGDLEPGTILEGYRGGMFPMGLGQGGGPPLGWWSPDPRGVLTPGALHISRSLRRSLRRFEIRIDTAFEQVVTGCADPRRCGAWISGEIAAAYLDLHRLGWAHSIEVWADEELVGGLYGLCFGGLFAAESMFHRVADASKTAVVALVGLMDRVRPEPSSAGTPAWVIDVQWATPHLTSLGVREVSRQWYRAQLPALIEGADRPAV